MKGTTSIVWFRQDLRLHDNEALTDAINSSEHIIPVYVFDKRTFGGRTTQFGFPKTGSLRAKFIIESIDNLRNDLRSKGSDLIVRIGKPEEVISDLARTLRVRWVFCNRERTREEVAVQDALEKKLWTTGQELRFSRGKMLFHTSDLPFPITHSPDIFSQFRKEVEKIVAIRSPLPSPISGYSKIPSDVDLGEIPNLKNFNLQTPIGEGGHGFSFKGGESEAFKRLEEFFWDTKSIENYKTTKNGLSGKNYSTKFSPWLAQGCLSPKLIYSEIKKFEDMNGANESTYGLCRELMRRDFYRLMLKKYGDIIFKKGGTKKTPRTDLKEDRSLLKIWIEGRTGIPFVDANMRELKTTGFISNRGRQNVASFLINDLKISWQMGAEYFESVLIDYDPSSNYGNWNYLAGVGSNPKENKNLNIMAQALKYDPDGYYIRQWIPEIAMLTKSAIYNPEVLDSELASSIGYNHGASYPRPMIDINKWL